MDTPIDLAVPDVQLAVGAGVGHFRGRQAFTAFLASYRNCFADMPSIAEIRDVGTAFGVVRVYRFEGQGDGLPMILLPGRNGPTPVYGTNLPPLLEHRDVYCLDLLGEAGLSVQTVPIADADDQAAWLDAVLAGLGMTSVHLSGISIGGWLAVNYAVRRPGRAASLTLLDPAMTFDRIPVPLLLASVPMVLPGVPLSVRRRLLSWISGGSDIGEAAAVATLITAATDDFVLKLPPPSRFTDGQLSALRIPVLALLGGRSVVVRAERAAQNARKWLYHGQVEVWPAASHAISGEYPVEIAERAQRFWAQIEG